MTDYAMSVTLDKTFVTGYRSLDPTSSKVLPMLLTVSDNVVGKSHIVLRPAPNVSDRS